MEIAVTGVSKILWNSKDVSKDVSGYLSSVTYTDHEEAMSDEISLTFDNTDGKWAMEWYPSEGDTIQLFVGYLSKMMSCGIFEIDEIVASGPPDTVEVKALATGTTKAFRTRNNKVFEDLTLRQIAQFYCKKHGLKLIDTSAMLSEINIDSKTQEDQTDLQFLSDLAKEYGFIFNLRGTKLVFISYADLDKTASIASIDKSEVGQYSFTEKMHEVVKKASVKATDSESGDKMSWEATDVLDSKKSDTEVFAGSMTSKKQAEAKAKAKLWAKNKFRHVGSLSDLPGSTNLVAGVNIDLTGFGQMSGKYHIVTSTHKVDGMYTTSLDMRRTGTVPEPQKVPKKNEDETTTEQTAYDDTNEELEDDK